MALSKKLLSGMLALFIILGISATESELLVNGDFEKGSPKGLVLKNASIVNDGGKFLKLEGKDSSAVIKGIKTEPGQRYKLSFQAKAGAKTLTSNGYQSFRVYVSWLDTERQEGTEWLDSFPEGYQSKTLIFNAPMCNKPMIISCELKDAGSLYLDNFKLEALPPEKLHDVKISIDNPFYRNIIYSSDPVSEITGSVAANENVASAELKFSEKDSGKVIFEKKFANIKDKFDFSIPAEDLKYGKYVLSITPIAKDGKTLDKVETPIWKLEKGPVEVIYKKDLNCYINGKLFYPILFMQTGSNGYGNSKVELANGFYYSRKNGANIFYIHLPERANYKKILEILDIAKEFDCKIIFEVAYIKAATDNESFMKWKHEFLNKIRPEIIAHDALFGYFLSDEPMWGGKPLEALIPAYNFIKQIDPYRPIWISEAPRGAIKDLSKFSTVCDIYGGDIYPVPTPGNHSDLEDKNLTCVGKYTIRFREAINARKPILMMLQGFSWGTYLARKPEIYPNNAELDFMAFDCLVNGAQSIGYWGMYCINNPGFWNDLLANTQKLAALSGIITWKDAPEGIVKCNNPSIKFLTKLIDGNIYIIAVNESGKEIEASFEGSFSKSSIQVVFENRQLPCFGKFTDKFPAYGYHVYATGDLPESIVKPIPVNKKIEAEGSFLIKNASFSTYNGNAQWIWFPGESRTALSMAAFKKEFQIKELPAKAEITVTADDHYVLFVNGTKVGEDSSGFNIAESYDITHYLAKGTNSVYIEAADAGVAPCALLVDISLLDSNRKTSNIHSDSSWQTMKIKKFHDSPNFEFKGVNSEKIADYGNSPWLLIRVNRIYKEK